MLATKGAVTVERDKEKPQRIGPRHLLRPGDRLNVLASGEALLVFLVDGHREKVKAKSQATVNAKGCTPATAVERFDPAKLTAAGLDNLRDHARSERGQLTVVSATADWRVLSTSDFEEDGYATPALADGRIYLRTAGHLYCFGLPGAK